MRIKDEKSKKELKEIKELEEWKKMKSIGKKKYVWSNGVLYWGVFLAIFWPIGFQFIDKGFSIHSLLEPSFFKNLLISFIFFPIVGSLHAILQWNKYEKKYEKKYNKRH